MKIAITGATGGLGRDLLRVFDQEHQTFPLTRKDFDITNLEKTKEVIAKIKPEIIVHSAAFTDVDGCQLQPDKAYQVNALGTAHVALASQESKTILVYISTDYVFNGKKDGPYHEFDKPDPISTYGRSKLAGEKYVSTFLSRFFIIRTAWLFGNYSSSFISRTVSLAREGTALKIVEDQTGSPTYTLDLALGLKDLIALPAFGIYHLVNGGHCSRVTLARKMLTLAGLDENLIKPVKSQHLKRPALRPPNSSLENLRLKLYRRDRMRPWEEAVEAFLKESSD